MLLYNELSQIAFLSGILKIPFLISLSELKFYLFFR
ncbi:hypothetical protein SAMN05443543_10133 [Flavobacterium flevense]|nr:hypothetical protein SAMN05443543_10133 [Flavobacterium flevense]